MGFFVYRHLGLLRCNIVLMKRFLPLLMLTGLLFGQDLLNLKSGESLEGTFYGKIGRDFHKIFLLYLIYYLKHIAQTTSQ